MAHNFIFLVFSVVCLASYAQEQAMSLRDYIEAAQEHSPLLTDYRNQVKMQQAEVERLRSMYTRGRWSVTGEWLFVPIIATHDGHTAFKPFAQSSDKYWGYDLGESSGHLHAGITFLKPLLGQSSYQVAKEQSDIAIAVANNSFKMHVHELEYSVVQQYLLCLLDQRQIAYADSVEEVLQLQKALVERMAKEALMHQSDLHLIEAQRKANAELRAAAEQDFCTHLADLNILCGLSDNQPRALPELDEATLLPISGAPSLFLERYRLDSLSHEAAYRNFNLQYRPQLNFYADGGMQVGDYSALYRHFGWSAGLTFSWTLPDGKQRKQKKLQTQLSQNSISAYRTYAEQQRMSKLRECRKEFARSKERDALLSQQIEEYEAVLRDYAKEIRHGQRSMLDYITVLRSKIQTERDRMLLQANRQLIVACYNYWNW